MGLFSLFSSRKGNDPVPERPARRTRSDAGVGTASSRRLAEEYADDTLDPEFPQKQRARRRLIGAVVLLVAAVIVLPIVFETKPRPVVDGIAVRVSNGPGGNAAREEPRKAAPLPPVPPPRAESQALDAGEELISAPAASRSAEKPAEKPVVADKPADKPAAPADVKAAGSGKYLILIGAFSSEDKARRWMSKLKEAKVPAYLEKKTFADGDRVLLRAGPFSDREAAASAEKRVKAAGLNSKVIEQ